MFLAVDIGNTNIVLALHNGETWLNTFRYETKKKQPQMFYEKGLLDILLEWGVNRSAITKVGISSVVPTINERIAQAVERVIGLPAVILGPDVYSKLDMHIPKPNEIGSDLVANAYGVKTKYGVDAIIVDFGTALTFTVFSKQAGIKGVTIAPGIHTAISALSGNTAQLPVVPLEIPESAIGNSTATAIQAGIVYGYVGLLKEILNQMKKELSPIEYKVIATGGLSHFAKHDDLHFDQIEKNLTLDGIKSIVECLS